MILLNDFYHIIHYSEEEATFSYTISFNPEHLIFKAHFPEKPITPGVCIIQIAQELLEKHQQRKLYLKKTINVKFLSVLSPDDHSCISYNFLKFITNHTGCKVLITVEKENEVCAKLSLLFDYESI